MKTHNYTGSLLARCALLLMLGAHNALANLTVSPAPGDEPTCCLGNGPCTINVTATLTVPAGESGSLMITPGWAPFDAVGPQKIEANSEGQGETVTLSFTGTVTEPGVYAVSVFPGPTLHFNVQGIPSKTEVNKWIAFDDLTKPNKFDTFCGSNTLVRFFCPVMGADGCDDCPPQWSGNVEPVPSDPDNCHIRQGWFGGKGIHHVTAKIGDHEARCSFFTSDPQAQFVNTPTHVSDGCEVEVNVNVSGGWAPYQVVYHYPGYDPRPPDETLWSALTEIGYWLEEGSNQDSGGDGDYTFKQTIQYFEQPLGLTLEKSYTAWPLHATFEAQTGMTQRSWIQQNLYNQDGFPVVVFNDPTNSPFASSYVFQVSVVDAKGCSVAASKTIWAHPDVEIQRVTRDLEAADCNTANWKFPNCTGTYEWTTATSECVTAGTTFSSTYSVNVSVHGGVALKSAFGVTGSKTITHTHQKTQCWDQKGRDPHLMIAVPTVNWYDGELVSYECSSEGKTQKGTFKLKAVKHWVVDWVKNGGTHVSCPGNIISSTNNSLPAVMPNN